MRATRPGRGLGWMAGAVGLLVAGRLWRRRAGASLSEPAALEVPPAWPPDDEAPSTPRWDLTQEDAAPWRDRDGVPAPGGPPRIRRGPSGREHFWLEP
ncbi:hypothetical protein [Corallococcus exercitus]|uniref:hypothetical protein n=1 Tax=Corallococcus exercitus TaxID=2316736 RepID=UPI0011C3FD8A|nr:hypothetical protein [Corallococcus exercitus]